MGLLLTCFQRAVAVMPAAGRSAVGVLVGVLLGVAVDVSSLGVTVGVAGGPFREAQALRPKDSSSPEAVISQGRGGDGRCGFDDRERVRGAATHAGEATIVLAPQRDQAGDRSTPPWDLLSGSHSKKRAVLAAPAV